MANSIFWPDALAIAVLSFVILSSLSIIIGTFNSAALRDRTSLSNRLFENESGKATEKSQERFSRRSFQVRGCIVAANICGCCISMSRTFFPGLPSIAQYCEILTWFSFLPVTSCIVVKRNPVICFQDCFKLSISYTAVMVVAIVQIFDTDSDFPALYFNITHAFLSFFGCVVCLCIPRHPDIFRNENLVDGQWSVSVINRLSFSWVSPILKRAATKGRIELEDLPEVGHNMGAKELCASFDSQCNSRTVAHRLIVSHAPAIIGVYGFTILSTILDFAPQLAMFQLLKILEAPHSTESPNITATYWAATLGLIMFAKTIVENQMWWLSQNHMTIPFRIQLSAMIFVKAMWRKDVQGGHQPCREQDVPSLPDAKEADHQTQQKTINLVAVDSKRVADFCTFQNQFVGVIGKIIVSCVFLLSLIGWQALLAGIFVQLLTIPVNVHFSKRYTNAQGELMSIRDSKLSILSEVLMGIRQIKFSALENSWYAIILKIREEELATQYKAFFADSLMVFCWLAGPVILSAVSITVYVLIHGSLSASVAFTTISILATLQGTLAWIPGLTTSGIAAWTSLGRIEAYLNTPNKSDHISPGDTIIFKKATMSWPADGEANEETFLLTEIDVIFPNQELTLISGPTGSGKSLLLSCLLGEADLLSGSVSMPMPTSYCFQGESSSSYSEWVIPTTKAFVGQRPWVENCTFRENILFGLPLAGDRYHNVLFACALEDDLKILPDGDQTEIGANGVNLSGGQLWRLTLARAIYSRAGILVVDDIFSAVDACVGRHVVEHAICGNLGQGRTMIIATHHFGLFSKHKHYSIRLDEGHVVFSGYINQTNQETLGDERTEIEIQDVSECSNQSSSTGIHPVIRELTSENDALIVRSSSPSKHQAFSSSDASTTENELLRDGKAPPRKFVEDEQRYSGRISLAAYSVYLTSSNEIMLWAAVFFTFIIYEAAILFCSWWIVLWTESYDKVNFFAQSFAPYHSIHAVRAPEIYTQSTDPDLSYYLGVYSGISIFVATMGAVRYLLVFQRSIVASRKLFASFTYALMHAPLRWIDTVPLGRILNRFSADFEAADSELGPAIATALNYSFRVLGIVIAGTFISPYIILLAIPLLALSSLCASYYLQAARQTKRIESIARSPVFEAFGSLLAGVTTIRASERTDACISSLFSKLDDHCKTLWYTWCFNSWLTIRLGVIGAIFTVGMALMVVFLKSISASMAGFVLIATLDYSDAVMWVLRQYSDIELGMNSVERILEYSKIGIENQEGKDVPAAWPTEGAFVVTDLVVGYAPDLPPTLNNLSFKILPSERIGVVGRTGAGKSSLALAIFRVLEARQGSIVIDGIDIAKIKLQDLRSRLIIIPQNPVLFSGTIRSNLDPFDSHSDEDILQALHRVYLISSAELEIKRALNLRSTSSLSLNLFADLQSQVGEGGHNFSQGQRQLLCLARAIISRPKVLILDEATSAVDKEMDLLIQRSIREEFTNCTLIVIAHRLSTVIDFDKILVMGAGRKLEFGTPRELIEADRVFAGMLRQSGDVVEY